MGTITGIRKGKGRAKRVNIFIDGRFALALGAEIAVKDKLAVGEELTSERIGALAVIDQTRRGMDVAARYLGYRPRSEAELREKLQRRGFAEGIIDVVVSKLKEQGLVDDIAFARFWMENRESFSPRSQYLARQELRQKGIADELINQSVSSVDDEESAYRAALSKARRLSVADYETFRQRLGGYLRRRGFDYGVINRTIEKIWQERPA